MNELGHSCFPDICHDSGHPVLDNLGCLVTVGRASVLSWSSVAGAPSIIQPASTKGIRLTLQLPHRREIRPTQIIHEWDRGRRRGGMVELRQTHKTQSLEGLR